MRSKILTVSVLIAMSLSLIQCSTAKTIKKTELLNQYEIIKVKTEDLNIQQNDVVDFVVEVLNIGQTPIKINGVRGSSGFLIPNWNSKPIDPEEKSTIELKFHAKKEGTKEGKETMLKVWIAINGKEEEVQIKTKVFTK